LQFPSEKSVGAHQALTNKPHAPPLPPSDPFLTAPTTRSTRSRQQTQTEISWEGATSETKFTKDNKKMVIYEIIKFEIFQLKRVGSPSGAIHSGVYHQLKMQQDLVRLRYHKQT
jgi:hypothetical protein